MSWKTNTSTKAPPRRYDPMKTGAAGVGFLKKNEFLTAGAYVVQVEDIRPSPKGEFILLEGQILASKPITDEEAPFEGPHFVQSLHDQYAAREINRVALALSDLKSTGLNNDEFLEVLRQPEIADKMNLYLDGQGAYPVFMGIYVVLKKPNKQGKRYPEIFPCAIPEKFYADLEKGVVPNEVWKEVIA